MKNREKMLLFKFVCHFINVPDKQIFKEEFLWQTYAL